MTAPDFTIADVLAWARTKPADERYDYCNGGSCAVAQFLIETRRSFDPCMGGNFAELGGAEWRDDACKTHIAPHTIMVAASGGQGNERHWTFGQLVARLEALCPETPVTPSDWARVDAYLTDIETVSA